MHNLNITYSQLRETSKDIEQLYDSFNLTKQKMITSLTRGEENEFGRLASSYDIGAKAVDDAKELGVKVLAKMDAKRQKLWTKFHGDIENMSLADAQAITKSINKLPYDEAMEMISENAEIRAGLQRYVMTFGIGGIDNALSNRDRVFNLMHTQRLEKINAVTEAIPQLLQSYDEGVQLVVSENSASNWNEAKQIAKGRYDGDQ